MGFINIRRINLSFIAAIALSAGACTEDAGSDDAADSEDASTGEVGTSTGGDDTMTPITTTIATTTMPPNMDDSTGGDGEDESTGDEPDPDTGDTGGSTGGGEELSCASYCGIYMDACADYSDYANMQACMDHCGQWPLGTVEDVAGDSLGCRTYHVTVASSAEPDVHCPHAGPNGDGVCAAEEAPDCETYCSNYMGNCTEDNNVYADLDDCMTQCAPWYPGAEEDVAGNTIGCRTYHAGAPAFGDPEEHCPHSGPGGAGVCVF